MSEEEIAERDRQALTPEGLFARDFLDFPTAFAIQRTYGESLEHHPRCSSVPGWCAISGPALLCDCGAIEGKWAELREEAAS